MLDTLDLDYYVKLGKSYRRINRTPLRRTLWVAVPILMIALLIWFNYKDTPGAVYTLQDGEWQEFDVPISGRPTHIEQSSTGVLWVSTEYPDGIHRFDGEQWTSFSSDDYGIKTRATLHAFDTNGDELWLATSGSISHFADETWTTYEDIYDYDRRNDRLDIVASDQGVVLTVDHGSSGQLFQFDDGQWTLVDPVNTLNIDPNNAEYSVPRVFEEEDGTIWMYDLGVYRLDEGEWRSFSLLRNVPLLALSVSRYGVVMMDQQSIGEFPFDGERRIRSYSQIGVSDFRQFTSINTTPNDLIFATKNNEIWRLSIDSGVWRQLPTLISSFSVSYVTTDANGNLWLVSNDDSTSTSFFLLLARNFIPMCMPLFLVLISLYFLTGNRSAQRRKISARETLQDIIPDLPVYHSGATPTEKSPRRGFWAFFVLIIALFIIPLTSIPGSSYIPLIVLVLFFALGPIKAFFRSFDNSLTIENRAYLRRNALVSVIFMVLFFGLPIFLLFFLPIPATSPLGGFIAMIWMIAVMIFVYYGIIMLPAQVVIRFAVGKGNYAKANSWIAWLLKIAPNYGGFNSLKAINDYFQGDLESARGYYRKVLEEVQNCPPATLSLMLTNLAMVEEDETNKLHFLEEAVKLYPESSIPYRQLALFYLDQSIQPQRAMEVTDAMMNFAPRKPLSLRFNLNYSWHVVLLVHAWALAGIGRFEEANALVERAINEMGEYHYPVNALIYTIAGNIKRLESQIEDARAYYQRAVTLDPDGLNGRQAAQALSDLSSTAD